jgi:hypothetical protein
LLPNINAKTRNSSQLSINSSHNESIIDVDWVSNTINKQNDLNRYKRKPNTNMKVILKKANNKSTLEDRIFQHTQDARA